MKKILPLLLCFTVFLLFNAHAQQPVMDWFKLIGGNGMNASSAMEIDGDGNLFLVGGFTDNVDFDPDPNTTRIINPEGGKDAYILKLDPDGNLLWVKHSRGPKDIFISDICIDIYGNSYITGSFMGLATLDTTTYSSSDSTDVFIQKRSSSGDIIWTRTFGGRGHDKGNSISVDDFGNIYTCGEFTDTNNINQTPLISEGEKDMFISKHDSLGNLVWAHSIGWIGEDYANKIEVVETQLGTCLYISAAFQDSVDFFGRSYQSEGGYDIVGFMVYASTGTLVSYGGLDYVARIGGLGHDYAYDFVFDKDLNIYSTGNFSDNCDLDPKDYSTKYYTPNCNGPDAFLLKMSSTAFFQWAVQYGSSKCNSNSTTFGMDIDIDTSGNIYSSGWYSDTIDFYFPNDTSQLVFQSGSYYSYINKVSPTGELIWIARIAGDSSAYITDIKIAQNGDIFLTGVYNGGINFIGDNSYGAIGNSPTPNNDIFLIKLNQKYFMSGKVLDSFSNGTDSSLVYLIELDPGAAGADTIERVYTDTSGHFHFNLVDTGKYILKADATADLPSTMPTYYPSKFYWHDAEIFELVSDSSGIMIDLLYTPTPPSSIQGSGRIWGRLVEGTSYRGPSDPIDSIVIGMIRPNISNDIYMLDTTDQDGYFEFLNLPPGDYALFPDISGIPVDTVGWTDISITASDTETITFVADSSIITYDNDTIIVDIKEYTSELRLWPNPVYDQLSVSLTVPLNAVRVFDMKGSEVKVEAILTEKRIQIKTGALQQGIYVLELQYADKRGLAKFVKQ